MREGCSSPTLFLAGELCRRSIGLYLVVKSLQELFLVPGIRDQSGGDVRKCTRAARNPVPKLAVPSITVDSILQGVSMPGVGPLPHFFDTIRLPSSETRFPLFWNRSIILESCRPTEGFISWVDLERSAFAYAASCLLSSIRLTPSMSSISRRAPRARTQRCPRLVEPGVRRSRSTVSHTPAASPPT